MSDEDAGQRPVPGAALDQGSEAIPPRPPGEGSGSKVTPRPENTEIRATIEAAELAAEEIRRDAEERAAAHLQAAHQQADRLTSERVRSIAAVTDQLVGQAATIRAHSDELAGSLRRATEMLADAVEGPAPPGPDAPPPPAPPTAAIAPPVPAPPDPSDKERPAATAISATGVHEATRSDHPSAAIVDPDGPEFRARQLATAGAGRRTIAIVLRREFNVEPLPILNRVLG